MVETLRKRGGLQYHGWRWRLGARGGDMYKPRWPLVLGLPVLIFSGMLVGQTTDAAAPDESEPAKVAGPDCPFFGAQRERYVTEALRRSGAVRSTVHQLSSMT